MDTWLKNYLESLPFEQLSIVQKLALDAGVAEGQSLVVCAPTSSGKTLIGEIAALAGIHRKCVALYLVPLKALADQKYDEFVQRYGGKATKPVARVAISTGDRDEGDSDPQLLIATYEKALSLVMGDTIAVGNAVIVADELQLLGEDKRGPDVEILCAALKRKKPAQIVALTATVENGQDLSGWLECKLVRSSTRDIELIQEIWAKDQVYTVRFGEAEGAATRPKGGTAKNTLDAVRALLKDGRGPVLVFTETRRDAMDLAEEFAANRAKTPKGFDFSEQLSLFAEGTEFSERLKATAETKVVFHTADLTPSERSVVEQGLITSEFDVCFATPTLAAGVNFPFRSVLFDRINRRYIPPKELPLSAYRNMSGRAGRLGMHPNGYSILVPRDDDELRHANFLVTPENERLQSRLASMSVRRIVLSLIAARSADSPASIREFLEQTFYWYQIRDRNPSKLDELIEKIDAAIDWLAQHGMVDREGEQLTVTDLGATTARTGLLPSTAFAFAELFKSRGADLEGDFEEFELPLIHAACCCDEFDETIGQRFHPAINYGVGVQEVNDTLYAARLFSQFDWQAGKSNRSAVAVYLFISGEVERRISARTGIPSGQVHRFAGDIAWILDGVHRLAGVGSLHCSQKVMNQLGILSRRVRLGVPIQVVDLIRTAQVGRVPGFGRQCALALLRAKLADRESILAAERALLEKLLSRKERVDRLLEAIERDSPNSFEKARRVHQRIARQLGIEHQIRDAYDKYGDDYEAPVEALLRMDSEWKVTRLDDGKRKGVPDILVEYADRAVVIECKTTTKKPPVINKEEAFDVLTKATNIKDVHRVTLGKPGFDTFSESKACGSSEITLVSHPSFIDAVLLRRRGSISLDALFEWFREPGVAESTRLGVLADSLV